MKRISLFFIALALAATTCAYGRTDEGKQLSAIVSYATFYNATSGSYVETYMSFDAWNLNFVKSGDKWQSFVEVVLTISKDDSIELVKKYDLKSPAIDSPDNDRFNFIDIQRFAVGNGIHDMSIQLRDKNSSNDAVNITLKFAVYFDNKLPGLSSLQMMSNVRPTTTPNMLSRCGYDMEPYINDFVPEHISQINYYYEIYNIDQELRDPYVYTSSFVEVLETGEIIEKSRSFERHSVEPFIPIIGNIDISTLPSGNYNLVVEVYNKHNDKLLYRRVPFFRSNPSVNETTLMPNEITFASQIKDEQKLTLYVEALAPIANEQERRTIYELIKRPGVEEKQLFLYRFWTQREPLNAESAWLEYRDRIDYVQKNFSWPKTEGIHTDRGRVYLQYGPPDFVRDEKNYVSVRYLNEQGHIYYKPYQLWRYNNIPGDDINRCFIFWDEFRSGFYKLLNSNAKGEVREFDWERRLCGQQLNEGLVGDVGEQFERGY